MKINDMNGLLKIADSLLEELDQNAAGPELEKAAELDNEATLEKAPSELTSDIDNQDVYGDDEEFAEDVGEVIVKESDQLAAGPELEKAAELENEATLEKAPSELESDIDNKDVFPAEDHEQKEDVGEVVVESYSDLELMKILESNGYETTIKNLIILKEGLASGKFSINEEELETNPLEKDAEDAGVASDEPAETGKEEEKDEEDKKEDKKEEDEDDKKEEDEDKSEEKEAIDESLSGLISLISQINESISQVAAGPELEKAAELDNEATEETAPSELESSIDNKDVFPAEDHEQKEDVGEVVVKESEQLAAGPELEAANELKNEATSESKEKELTSDIDNKDVFPAEDHEQKEDVGEVVVESEQLAAGPELEKAAELDNEATEEKEPKTAEPSTDNQDIYPADEHKQVEDVVEVVIEAVSACKAKGKKATKENIAEEAKALFEMKNFDIDAAIMSKEWNGSSKFEEYEKLEGKGAECGLTGLRESVKYSSLKEACMLDEGYFAEDSFVKETAEEKITKLTEQVSLLMAREASDPLYDELLKESAYCMRLREQIQGKYKRSASQKVALITEAIESKSVNEASTAVKRAASGDSDAMEDLVMGKRRGAEIAASKSGRDEERAADKAERNVERKVSKTEDAIYYSKK